MTMQSLGVIYLPIEIKVRELHGKLLLAAAGELHSNAMSLEGGRNLEGDR